MLPFAFFERAIDPVAPPGAAPARTLGVPVPDAAPPRSLIGFYWHFARQSRALFAALFLAGMVVALLDLLIPLFIGRVIGLLERHAPEALWAEAGWSLAVMALVLLVCRPAAILVQNLVVQQAIIPGVTSMIRWQSHWHVVRQGLPFFQEDFAGRIANRVMQAAPALRESVVQSVQAVWYILVYGTGAMIALAATDMRLAVPILLWFLLYATLLRLIVPRMRDRARKASEARSALTGRVVDSYTNIMTVKLFARAEQEDAFVREALETLNRDFGHQTRLVTLNGLLLSTLNACMLVSTAALAIWLWSRGEIPLAMVAAALPMAWQIANISGWVAFNVAGIFENIGVVQEAMGSIAVPPTAPDPPAAVPLRVSRGAIRFHLAARDMLPRHPPAAHFHGLRRVREIQDADEVADIAGIGRRDIGVAPIEGEAMHALAAHLHLGDEARLGRVGYVVHAHPRAEFLRALAELLVVHQHDPVGHTHLVRMPAHRDRDVVQHARLARVRHVHDRRAMRRPHVPDIHRGAIEPDLPAARRIEPRDLRGVARLLEGRMVHVRQGASPLRSNPCPISDRAQTSSAPVRRMRRTAPRARSRCRCGVRTRPRPARPACRTAPSRSACHPRWNARAP
ncbi:ABC transporter ATP-binding protein/permease [Leptolyngbya sp. 15MV]|nr:ABC transporter ATP-binding protein/permease [Leptolyngbya sp. 15MV]